MLKGPLTPGRKKAEVFGHFGHRAMPHSVVVGATTRLKKIASDKIASTSVHANDENLDRAVSDADDSIEELPSSPHYSDYAHC